MKTNPNQPATFLLKILCIGCCLVIILLAAPIYSFGQAPVISYPSPQSYATGVTISPLMPSNSGGAVSATVIDVLATGFNFPACVALDAARNIYVADYNDNVVKKIPAVGGAPVVIGTGFNGPSAVALDAMGNVYVTDQSNNVVKKIPVNGSAIVTIGPSFMQPTAIALDKYGNIYVCDQSGITKMPPGGGTPVSILGLSPGNHFNAIAVDNGGDVFYVDGVANQVKEILAVGGSSAVISSEPQGANVQRVAVDAAGNVYYTDFKYSFITKIVYGTSQKIKIGSGFSEPVGLALDAQGKIYVSEYAANAVSRITVGGYFISPALPNGLILDPNTGVISGTPNLASPATNYNVTALNNSGTGSATINLTISATPKPAISYSGPKVYHKNTKIAALVPVNNGGTITTEATLVAASTPGFPYGVAVDPAGNIYYTENQNKDVREIPAGGGASIILATGFVEPLDIAVDGSGNIFVNDGGSAIVKVPVGSVTPVTIATGRFFEIAADSTGDVYTVNGNNQIIEIRATGGTPVVLASLNSFFGPQGIAVDHAGNVYVTDNRLGKIIKIKVGTHTIVNLAIANTPLIGAAVDPDGNVYSIAINNHGLNMYVAATGSIINLVNGGFGQSFELAMDANRNIYSAMSTAKEIIKITTSGYYINQSLPTGLLISKATGVISGTPTTTSPATTYSVTALNNGGSSSASFSLKVSGNSSLANLVPSVSHLGVAFTPTKISYAMSVANPVSSISFTPTAADSTSSVGVNGVTVASGTASPSIPLSIGNNAVQVIVTATDGSKTTYSVSVKRLVSSNAYLATLLLSHGILTPKFSRSTSSYTASVGNPITSITVTPTTSDTTAAVTVNGTPVMSGTASGNITLATGTNTITVVVTAQDGTTTTTNTVTVTRAGGSLNTVYQPVGVATTNGLDGVAADDVLVHNGLSPNGDGINDFLLIDGIANYPENKLQIMTRNGQLIFEAKNYDNSNKVFDGHSNKTGAMQLPGTYFYSLDYTVKGEIKHKTGFLVIKY